MPFTRREIMGAMAAPAMAQTSASSLEDVTVRRYDEYADRLLKQQITDPADPHRGIVADAAELYPSSTASGILDAFNAVFHHPKSKFHRSALVLERMKLAADHFERSLTPDGNVDNPITNFNSPADTAFAVQNLAMAANIAKTRDSKEAFRIIEPSLRKTAASLVKGGIHTPNHRWVLCAALAQINEVWPDAKWVRRIDQWLAEGIDIDEDGQFDERSMIVYNPITDRAFTLMAAKLKRPELFEPVRRNLESALYLMHADYEMVTEISRRQDRNQRGEIGAYWFPMHYMAIRDGNGQFATIAAKYADKYAGLSLLMDMPELLKPLPAQQPLPDNYVKHFPALELVRIRRGPVSATVMLRDDSRFFQLRRGKAVLSAVRFASAFFGKGQFKAQSWRKEGESYVLTQKLDAGYYQPLDPPHPVHAGEWGKVRRERKRTEVCTLEQTATVTETKAGFRIRMQAHGTKGVPVAVEFSTRDPKSLGTGNLLPAKDAQGAYQLASGQAVIREGEDVIRFGPGAKANLYTQVRGAEPAMPGACVYLTGFAPFDHTIDIEC